MEGFLYLGPLILPKLMALACLISLLRFQRWCKHHPAMRSPELTATHILHRFEYFSPSQSQHSSTELMITERCSYLFVWKSFGAGGKFVRMGWCVYDLGFSFFSFHRALKPTPETLTTLNRTPGISPLALPLRPKPAIRTSSFSSTKLRQPSLGTRRGEEELYVSGVIL